jgi:hypothetical protein
LRPVLGFELRIRKKTGQIGETHSIGERSKLAGQFGDVGGSALRTVDIFGDLDRIRGISERPLVADKAGFFISVSLI